MRGMWAFLRQQSWTVFALVGLSLGVAFWVSGASIALAVTAFVVIGVVIVVTAVDMVRDLLAGHWGLDILAVVAMVATLAVREYMAGLIIALMLTGGEALEAWAARRAAHELNMLLNRAPTVAQRIDPATGQIDQIPVGEVQVGDDLLVRSSEVVPVDGTLLSDHASIDESSVTGEPMPVTYQCGAALLSGTVNGTMTFRMRAERSARDSQYATIVQLVTEAVRSRAPMVRLADRYAVPFTVVSLLIAGFAWFVSGNPVRFAEVLVVATPCPLLIAAPVAFMGGMSSAAKLGVIIKEGGALESLAKARSVAFDKTGTLTQGKPDVVDIRSVGRPTDVVLALAGAAEQHSVHAFAQPIAEFVAKQGVTLPEVLAAEEIATQGIAATLGDGSRVRVGKPTFIAETVGEFERQILAPGQTAVYVSIDKTLAGVIVLSDPVRPGAAETISRLRAAGIESVAMVTGDTQPTAESIAHAIGVSTVFAETTPQEKVDIVRGLEPKPVLMVGDGINDAPVLAAADVGIAMAGRGATAASESASAVITSDDITRVADATAVSRRTVAIALQSIWTGIAASVGLMLVAAVGLLPAVAGALLQEAVDLVAILASLRALTIYRTIRQAEPTLARQPVPERLTPAGQQ